MKSIDQIEVEVANSQAALRQMRILAASLAAPGNAADAAEHESLARAIGVQAGRIQALLWVISTFDEPLVR